ESQGREPYSAPRPATSDGDLRAQNASQEAGAEPGAHAEHGGPPKESPWVVTVPLILLAIPSVYAGFAYIGPMLFGGYFGDSIAIAESHEAVAKLKEEWHGAI